MNTTARYCEVKELIERMKGINPSSYISIGYVAIDMFRLSEILIKLNEPKIEWVLLEHFKYKPALLILPLFFDDFSKETKVNIWKNIYSIDLSKPEIVSFLKSITQEQVYRLTQTTKLEYDERSLEVIYELFMSSVDRDKLDKEAIEDDIKELFIYYLKSVNMCKYDLHITVLNSILYSDVTLTGVINLKNILLPKVNSKDVVINLILLASSYIYMTDLTNKILVDKNRNNYLLQYLFSYKNIERMMTNEWINTN